VQVYTGQPTGTFAAGAISITGGTGGTTGGNGGPVNVIGGAAAAGQNGDGGALQLVAGAGQGTGNGADVTVKPGAGAAAGTVNVQDSAGNTLIAAGGAGVQLKDSAGNTQLQLSTSGVSIGLDATHALRTLVMAISDLGGGTSATLSNTHGAGYAVYKTSGATLVFTTTSMPDGYVVLVMTTNAGGCAVSPLVTGASGTVAQGQVKLFILVGGSFFSLA
jgi:hypothetical protein